MVEVLKLPPNASGTRENLAAMPEFMEELREVASRGDLTEGECRYWSRLALLMSVKVLDRGEVRRAQDLASFASDILKAVRS